MENKLFTIIGIILASAIATSCAVDGDDSYEITHTANNPTTWTATQISDNNITSAVAALPQIIKQAMDGSGLPGLAVAVVRADEVLFINGFGLRSTRSADLVDTDTVFQLASLSKPVGATVISRAVSAGTVSWDDPVKKYLPDFRIDNSSDYVSINVTLGDLYSHRSGLPGHAGDLLEDLGYSREEILPRLQFLPVGNFRDQYEYTNFGLTAAGEAVARAHDTSWEDLSEKLLYQPAGMNSTSSRYADYLHAGNRATTHQRKNGIWIPGPARNPDPESPAGGVSSSIRDMARWMRLHLGNGKLEQNQLIDAEVIQIMRQPHFISKVSTNSLSRPSMYGYGLGSSVDGTGRVRWSHSGAFMLGAATNVVFLPVGDIAITVLSNGEPHGIPEAITAQFMDIVETGKVQFDWLNLYQQAFSGFYSNPGKLAGKKVPLRPEPAQNYENYTGVYTNRYFGIAKIAIKDNQLLMSLGPEPQQFVVQHWDGDEFSYFPRGENAVGISSVSFSADTRQLSVEYLNDNGLGIFTKL